MRIHGKAIKNADGKWVTYRTDGLRPDSAWSGWNSNDNSMM